MNPFAPTMVPRILMPQVALADIPALIEHIEGHGVATAWHDADPRRLRAHQLVGFNHGAADVERIRHDPKAMASPVLTSWDRFIVDGHHRWLVHLETRTRCPTIKIGARWERAIALVATFPRAFHQGDREARLP